MGYQALLFCPDEKLAHVVSQVFAELDFSVEHVQEPFAAVKRLMAQRFDAVVVDCENEPNATLLLKSARTSSANQSSLAIALVEGQAGVAKAYRIGANLVLTKPINVEQAKGTLRVARGLLRKTADAAAVTHVNPSVAPAASLTPSAPPATFPAKAVTAESVVPQPTQSALPEFETPLPTMTASASLEASVEEAPVAQPASEVHAQPSAAAQKSAEAQPPTVVEPAKPLAAPVASKASASPALSLTSGRGAAAAPAPAREGAEKKTVEFEAAYQKQDSTQMSASASGLDGPTFAALEDEHAGGSGSSKKILVAAAVILALAALGYLGWSKLTTPKTKVSSPPVSELQSPPQQAAPATAAPMSPPATTPATRTTNQAGANTLAGTSKTAVASAAAAGSSSALRIDLSPDAETQTTKPGKAPIVVKSNPAKKTGARTEEALAQLPSPLQVAATNESGISSLAVPSTHSQPSLVTVNISQGVSQGLLIKRVQPKYPPNARAMHLQGTVQLEATINKEGNIVDLRVLKGDVTLAQAAMDAVRQWRYKPYYLDRVPVDIQTQITVNFKLPN
jgi:TonB family protein